MDSKQTSIKIICNNSQVKKNKQIKEWGLSFLINENILFDTSEDTSSLRQGFEQNDVDLKKIKKIILSHNHWDHIGGIPLLLEQKNDLEIFLTSDFDQDFKNQITKSQNKYYTADKITKLDNNILLSEEFSSPYKGKDLKEKCIIIENNNNITVLTGCAHAGIVNIVESIKTLFPQKKLSLVAGGFHLSKENKDFVEKIADMLYAAQIHAILPLHCSGEYINEYIQKKYQNFLIIPKDNQIIF